MNDTELTESAVAAPLLPDRKVRTEVVRERKAHAAQLLVVAASGQPMGIYYNLYAGLSGLLRCYAEQADTDVLANNPVQKVCTTLNPFQDWYEVSRDFVLWTRAALVNEPLRALERLDTELPETARYYIVVSF